jgi:hypothetical protein
MGGGVWSGRRDSNPRPSPWQGDALPTEPLPLGPTASKGGAEGQDRTGDTAIFSRVLYRLSYLGPKTSHAELPVGGPQDTTALSGSATGGWAIRRVPNPRRRRQDGPLARPTDRRTGRAGAQVGVPPADGPLVRPTDRRTGRAGAQVDLPRSNGPLARPREDSAARTAPRRPSPPGSATARLPVPRDSRRDSPTPARRATRPRPSRAAGRRSAAAGD